MFLTSHELNRYDSIKKSEKIYRKQLLSQFIIHNKEIFHTKISTICKQN